MLRALRKFFKKPSKKRLPPPRLRFMEAAKQDNITAFWPENNQSFDGILAFQLEKIRGRSRALSVNDPYYARFIDLACENIVGHQGIKLQMRLVSSYGEDGSPVPDHEKNAFIENLFKTWGKRKTASSSFKYSWHSLQMLAVSTVVRDGEIFFRKIRDKSSPFLFCLEPFEADLVPLHLNKDLAGGRKIRMGIEYDKGGRILAYHVLNRHPGDFFPSQSFVGKTDRLPAEDIIHVFLRERVSQSRGLPWSAPSLLKSYLLDKYTDSEAVAANISSNKMGFYVKDPEQNTEINYGEAEEGAAGLPTYETRPGIIEELPDGWDFKSYDPQHPSTAFGDFVKSTLRSVASGMGIGYNHLANDYESVNYSSLRGSNLVEREHWRRLQKWLIESLHEEVFPDFLKMSVISGKLDVPATELESLNFYEWRPRGWAWVDPLKDIKASETAIALGLDSATNILASQGRDYEEVLQELKNEFNLRQKYGVELTPPPAPSAEEEKEIPDDEKI